MDFPRGAVVKKSACQCRRCKRRRFDTWVGNIPWSRKWLPTPVFLAGESHGQRSLVCCNPWGRKELDTTEQLSTHTAHAFEYSFSLDKNVSKQIP